jgi:hypothetical protein
MLRRLNPNRRVAALLLVFPIDFCNSLMDDTFWIKSALDVPGDVVALVKIPL